MARDEGGSAFPKYVGGNRDLAPGEEAGMTLRDYFAGQALAAMVPNIPYVTVRPWDGNDTRIIENIGVLAYQIADAMLKERAK